MSKVLRSMVVVTVLLGAAAPLLAGPNLVTTERFVKELPLEGVGSFWIDNPVGNIEITGSELPGVMVSVQKVVTAANDAAMRKGREETEVRMGGDTKICVIRTVLPEFRHPLWSSNVTYVVRVPRSIDVKVASQSSDRIHISNIFGHVTVSNTNGAVILDKMMGTCDVESVNGAITYEPLGKPTVGAQLSTINGTISVIVPADAGFRWNGETVAGDLLSNVAVRGRWVGTAFRGSVNSPGGPVITTTSMMGKVYLLKKGSKASTARSVRNLNIKQASSEPDPEPVPLLRTIQLPIVEGNFTYSTNLGNISIGEVRGGARVETGAGEVQLGAVFGDCNVLSLGGPLDLGEISGSVVARTSAGDIFIRGVRDGGLISTDGGSIRLLYTSGPTTLHSGGGDIVVRQATAALSADTRSGDIVLTMDSSVRSAKISAKTTQGNINVNVGSHFGADLDLTVLTSGTPTDAIHSDFPGMTVKREQVGNKMRIHATGKVNGGGEKIELYAEEGTIRLSNAATSPAQ